MKPAKMKRQRPNRGLVLAFAVAGLSLLGVKL